MEEYYFQFCQKIVVFSADEGRVLLCKRKSEADYDGIFSFIGGKMEVADETIITGLLREKNEEVGERFKIKINPVCSINVLFRKKDGSSMILPHYYALHIGGEIELNKKEYSEYQWVGLENIAGFEPKIPTIPDIIERLLRVKKCFKTQEFVII